MLHCFRQNGHWFLISCFTKLLKLYFYGLLCSIWPNNDVAINSASSSSSLAFPVIWGRRYGWRSSLSSTPCLLPRPLSILSSVSLSSFFQVSLSSSLSSYVLFFHPHHLTIPFQSFLRYLFSCLRYFRRSSKVYVPDLVISGHPTHPSQHPHLINLNPCFLSFRGGPCFRSI